MTGLEYPEQSTSVYGGLVYWFESSFWKRAQTQYCTYRLRRRICERRPIKSGDYHEEMDGNRFEAWFKLILTKAAPGLVIVMDNASYHSRRLEHIPISASRNSVVMDWLASITHEETMLKTESLSLVRQDRANYIKYIVDEMTKEFNVSVLRLPPYHCELNPIDIIWAEVKNYVARKN